MVVIFAFDSETLRLIEFGTKLSVPSYKGRLIITIGEGSNFHNKLKDAQYKANLVRNPLLMEKL